MKGIFSVVGVLDAWKKGDLPDNQKVSIILNSHSILCKGELAISELLATDEEVDFAVDRVIKDLETVRKKAKEKIKNTNARIRKYCE